MQYLLFLHGNSGYANALQCYVIGHTHQPYFVRPCCNNFCVAINNTFLVGQSFHNIANLSLFIFINIDFVTITLILSESTLHYCRAAYWMTLVLSNVRTCTLKTMKQFVDFSNVHQLMAQRRPIIKWLVMLRCTNV